MIKLVKPKKVEPKKTIKVTRVRVGTQSRTFTNQSEARQYAKDVLDSGIIFMEIKEEEQEIKE